MIYIGIDPGLDGALAAVNTAGATGYWVNDTPTLTIASKTGNKRDYAVAYMVEYLETALGPDKDNPGKKIHAFIENVHSSPQMGVRSAWTMGYGSGVWIGMLAAMHIPFTPVTPQRWKKLMLDGMGHEKDASIARAQQLFPKADIRLKKHDGRAEALLIAEYGRKTHGQ